MKIKSKPYILPIIIISQFLCTSLWFAGNAIVDDLAIKTSLGTSIIGYMLSSVQLGFILGTLVFALLMIADRFMPSKVFMISALLASLFNSLILFESSSSILLIMARFGTGFFLAGIYPVGMKIAADYYKEGLGKALGYLVGALVLGSAFPHLVKGLTFGNYTLVIKITSVLAVLGGVGIWLFVPNGPYRKANTKIQLQAGNMLFRIPKFKKAAFGYFGHMWELYAFWAFVPFALSSYNTLHGKELSIPLWSFVIIAVGLFSCIIGGYFSQQMGSKKVAMVSLGVSGFFCIISPILFQLPVYLFIGIWCLWAMAVVSDSPQFSTLVASAAPSKLKGTGLTLVNCIGFSISIISIQLLSYLTEIINPIFIFTFLAIGPFLGVMNLLTKKRIMKQTLSQP